MRNQYQKQRMEERIARAKRLKRLYGNGKGPTLEQIGAAELPKPISRERVRQLIKSLEVSK